MKFALLVASVYAAAGTANSVADGSECSGDTDCSTATSSCCQKYDAVGPSGAATTTAPTKICSPAITVASGSETGPNYLRASDCKGRTAAGAASLAATAAAAATALYAML